MGFRKPIPHPMGPHQWGPHGDPIAPWGGAQTLGAFCIVVSYCFLGQIPFMYQTKRILSFSKLPNKYIIKIQYIFAFLETNLVSQVFKNGQSFEKNGLVCSLKLAKIGLVHFSFLINRFLCFVLRVSYRGKWSKTSQMQCMHVNVVTLMFK